MQPVHFDYCREGSPYYDRPPGHAGEQFDAADVPLDWARNTDDEWTVLLPPGLRLPDQGWKIHVSATPDNASAVLRLVQKYCAAERLAFKHLRDRQVLLRRSSKYGDRSASGKFVTIYPPDDARLERILAELGPLLDGQRGPYILSDLRIDDGPLYVRYGGFVERLGPSTTGELVPCIQDPQGRLVPDVRGPGFRPPEWAVLPECLRPSLTARNAGTLDDFPFRVQRALHFSNGGGVYQALDSRTGRQVLLKEARPLAGLDESGTDAVARLEQEHWALQRLAGLDCVPQLVERRIGREHHFLAREYVDGTPLYRELLQRNPLVTGALDGDTVSGYVQWAQSVLAQVERGLAQMHGRGVVFGDLHPSNILLQADGAVRFIDFETSSQVEFPVGQSIGAPGFRAPLWYRGVEVDRYALGCLRLAIYLPLTVVLCWTPRKVDQLLDVIGQSFPLPPGFAADVWRDLGSSPYPGQLREQLAAPIWPAVDRTTWPALRDRIATDLGAAATPDRADRLFPGDVEQFLHPDGGVTFSNGAAGVLWAMHRVGVAGSADHLDWLERRIARFRPSAAGFARGRAGLAYVLDCLGRHGAAAELLDSVLAEPLDDLDPSLAGGLAGIGLTALSHAETGDNGALAAAAAIADRLSDPASSRQMRRPGLINGDAGVALFLLRMFETTGDAALLDAAGAAVERDLQRLGWTDDPDADGLWRVPLLDGGGAGTAMVLHDLLPHRPEPRWRRTRDLIRESLRAPFVMQAGLWQGRAGTLAALLHVLEPSAGTRRSSDLAVVRHAAAFGWHAVVLDGSIGFLGDQSLRLSTDLATGTAGVLLALDTAFSDRGSALPFFGAAPARPRPS